MKKILAVLFFICLAIVLAYGGISYWIGGQALKLNDQMIARINDSDWTEVSTTTCQHGLFQLQGCDQRPLNPTRGRRFD